MSDENDIVVALGGFKKSERGQILDFIGALNGTAEPGRAALSNLWQTAIDTPRETRPLHPGKGG